MMVGTSSLVVMPPLKTKLYKIIEATKRKQLREELHNNKSNYENILISWKSLIQELLGKGEQA